MERVKTYADGEMPRRDGRGLFAAALLQRFPLLPVEEEGRLTDAVLRENFIERVFAFRRMQDLFGSRWNAGSLVRFHTAHKMSLLAHSTRAYEELGRLVASAGTMPRAQLRHQYATLFMRTLASPASRARHTNVLQHMAGHLKALLDAGSREELSSTILDYRHGLVPLVVPITLIRHHVRAHAVKYLDGQVYLDPHPRELMLRNHV